MNLILPKVYLKYLVFSMFIFIDLTIYNKKEKFVSLILESQTFIKQTYYLKKASLSKNNPEYNFFLKLGYK